MSADDAIWTELREVMERYKDKLPGEAAVLRAIIARLGQDAEARRELKLFLHRIAGTAGTYELADIAADASTLERHLDAGATIPELGHAATTLAELLERTSRRT